MGKQLSLLRERPRASLVESGLGPGEGPLLVTAPLKGEKKATGASGSTGRRAPRCPEVCYLNSSYPEKRWIRGQSPILAGILGVEGAPEACHPTRDPRLGGLLPHGGCPCALWRAEHEPGVLVAPRPVFGVRGMGSFWRTSGSASWELCVGGMGDPQAWCFIWGMGDPQIWSFVSVAGFRRFKALARG